MSDVLTERAPSKPCRIDECLTMKQEKTGMADLPYDILKLIMMFVAQSPNGVATFIRATSSCKELYKFTEDMDILKIVKFGSVYRINESFWNENGLLVKCASAGNKRASEIIWRKNKQEKLKRIMRMENPFLRAMSRESWVSSGEMKNQLPGRVDPAYIMYRLI